MKVTNSLAFSVERSYKGNLEKQSTEQVEKTDSDKIKEYLKSSYPQIQFDFFEIDGNIKKYAATKSGLNNIVISLEFLEKQTFEEFIGKTAKKLSNLMKKYQKSAQTEVYLLGKGIKSIGLIVDEEGKVSSWMAVSEQQEKKKSELERHLNLLKRQEEQLDPYQRIREKMIKSYKCSYSTNMMRLAGAKNEFAVRNLIAEKYGELSKVRGEITDQKEAAKIIRRIKKVIQQANIKIARLHKEEKIEQRRRVAKKEQDRRTEERLREEVRKKRISRKAQEHCQTIDMMDIFPEQSTERKHRIPLPEEYVDIDTSVSSVGIGDLGQSAGPGMGVTVEVQASIDVLV